MKDDGGTVTEATLSPMAHDLGCKMLDLALALDGKVIAPKNRKIVQPLSFICWPLSNISTRWNRERMT
jgi:hypothetical protein